MENLFMRNFELDGIGSFSRVVLIMNAGNPVVGLQWRSQRQSHFLDAERVLFTLLIYIINQF